MTHSRQPRMVEVELLALLPSLRPHLGPAPVMRTVDELATVRVGSARYSVPVGLCVGVVAVLVEGAAGAPLPRPLRWHEICQ